MAQTNDKQQNNQSRTGERSASLISQRSLLEGVGTAAAALGSAAIFHRSGAMAKAARQIDHGYRFLKDASKHVGKLATTPNITIDEVRDANKKILKAWKDSRQRLSDSPIELRVSNPDTMFGLIHGLNNFKATAGKNARKAFQRNALVAPARDKIIKEFKSADLNQQRKFSNFILRVSSDVHNKANIRTAYKRSKFTEEERNFADKLVADMQGRDTKEARTRFEEQMKKVAEQSYNRLHDIDFLESKFGKGSPLERLGAKITGTDGATIGDLLAQRKKIAKSSASVSRKGNKLTQNETMDLLEKLREHYASKGKEFEQRFLNLRPDSIALKKDSSGNVFSFNFPAEMLNDALSVGALTMPGKILKLRDLEQANKAPVIDFIANTTQDPTLAALVNKTHADGHKNRSIDGNYVRIMDEVYSIGEDGLSSAPVATNVKAISANFGWAQRMQHNLAGDTAYQESSNPIFHALDLFQDRSKYSGDVLGNIKSRITKFADDDWRGNVFERFLSPSQEQLQEFTAASVAGDLDYATHYIDNAKRVQRFLKENTYALTEDAAGQLEKASSGEAAKIFGALHSKDDSELLDMALGMDMDGILNHDLHDLIKRYANDPVKAMNSAMQLKTDRTRLSTSGGSLGDLVSPEYNNESADFFEQLKTELGKEAFLQHAADNQSDDAILQLFDNLSMGKLDKAETRRLAHLAMFQKRTEINAAENDSWEKVRKIEGVMNFNTDEVDQAFRKEFRHMMNENISSFEARELDENIFAPEAYNSYIHIKKAVDPFDIIRSANESIKAGSFAPIKDSTSLFFKQFGAGRGDMQNVTMATYTPYFLLSRLSDDLNNVGLGFSRDSMGSFKDLAISAVTKRILPIGIGATYLEWADDTSQEVTGTSISGAAANGVANVDLASRKLLDSFGVTPWLKELKSINPIMQYWGEKDDFMSYDERKKYYESGYDPVRKGAWWTFGGVQEARGGEIEYWAPSFARRINSDYKDKALYDGYFDKWSHSLLPTPTNPLSPLNYILNPYWLEEKHADDRPYAVSGTMFEEGTPWGAILNPTIGEIIKPQKELHEYRLRNGVDIKSALHALNENIKQAARDLSETNLLAVKGDAVTPVKFSAYDAPTEDTKVMSVQFKNGSVVNQSAGTYGVYDPDTNYSEFNTGVTAKALLSSSEFSYTKAIKAGVFSDQEYHANGEIGANEKGKLGVYSSASKPITTRELKKQTDFTLEESLKLDAYINGGAADKFALANLVHDFNPMNLIRRQNEDTKKRANEKDQFDSSEGIITPEKLSHYRPSMGMELLNDPDTIQELIHAGKGADFVKNATTSARLITGIYGYMGSQAGLGVYQDKFLATSADMSSFSRTFWDSGIGGAGGEVADIFRRFIPDYKRSLRINPLMNEMPDWLPDRFRYGDPFTAVKNGEMRLPGKGWESLNTLHPDQYGDYGAFDRFKILADIAPFSPEYKMWREIAKKTVTDPALKQEMAEIRSRVSKQGRKHDFYDYKVMGKDLEYDNVVVSEVLGYGKFRSGSTIYKIAGATVQSNDNETMSGVLSRYLHEGMTVTIAKDADESYQTNKDADRSINAAVYIDGENLAEQMITNGDATRKKNDDSAPATLGRMSSMQRLIGWTSELVGHMDVPWLSDQFLRIRSPLESYKAEIVYGTPYQSWEHPIDTFLQPAFERAIHQSSLAKTAFALLFDHITQEENVGKMAKHAAMWGRVLSDRGAFIGAATANLLIPGKANITKPAMQLGSSIATVGHFLTGGNSMLDEAISGASLGNEVARFFKKNRIVGAMAGSAVGTAYRVLTGKVGEEYIPERAIKRWEMQDYFDRLTYIKYMGLYHEAARRAKEEEDVDVEDLSERFEERTSFIQETQNKLKKIKEALRFSNDHITNDDKKSLMKSINKKMHALEEDTTIIEGGKWTHTALIYKQAAESTMYGIGKDSSWAQIITALPNTDKEYFMEFVKERNPDKREEILRYASPFLRKALALAWGTATPKSQSNAEYFKHHKLPTSDWEGWKPDTDLKDVEIKTIENEAMNLSDFGYYESQLRDPNVINAPTIDYHSTDNSLSVKHNLERILRGKGLKNVDVNVSSNTGLDTHQIVADIARYTGSDKLQSMVDESLEMQT